MTLFAFMRFCDDFGIFPHIADFQTMQWMYDTAEGVTPFNLPQVAAMDDTASKRCNSGSSHTSSTMKASDSTRFNARARGGLRRKRNSTCGPYDEKELVYGKLISR